MSVAGDSSTAHAGSGSCASRTRISVTSDRLPPTLIQVGQDEILLQDSRRLHAALVAANVPAQLEEYPRRWHVFQANAGVLADADRALESVAGFLRQHWAV